LDKTIIPLFLPQTNTKSKNILVKSYYASTIPPHNLSRELAKTAWIDFRPFSDANDSNDNDPNDLKTFEKKI